MPMDVLIVEDDVALGHAIGATLRRHDIGSEYVESSEDAIAALTSKPYCVVVLNLLLGEFKSGYYVIDVIRRMAVADRPYVIVVTGAQMTAVANLDRAIVNAIFIKPLQLDIVATTTRAAVMARSTATEGSVQATKLTPEATRLIESLRDASRTLEDSDVKKGAGG